MKPCIYFDNAATTYPKPNCVRKAVIDAMEHAGGNPGRSGHVLSRAAEEEVYAARCAVADFFGASPECVVFTYNATYALNLAICAFARPKTHILTSDLEHNSVLRPLYALRRKGMCEFSVFSAYRAGETPFAQAERIKQELQDALRPNTKAVVVTHASNLCSVTLPLQVIGDFCHAHRLHLIVDVSQSAGKLQIDMEKWHIDALCLPAHKGLYGIAGCGCVLFSRRASESAANLTPLIYGGSGVYSQEEAMPDFLPERMEGGTLCVPSIAALSAGIGFVRARMDEIVCRENALFAHAAEHLSAMPHLRLYAPQWQGSTLLFSCERYGANEIAAYLDQCGICVRAGYHCAPIAHAALGTPQDGAVRVSFGAFNTISQLDSFLFAMQDLVRCQK